MKKKSLILKFKKMKKQILTLVIAFLSFVGYAQVGVGTSNPTLTLEVVGTNDNGAVTGLDGVLVPRVNDADMSSATAGTIDGQMVYNTVAKKFYYWNATAWTVVGGVAGPTDLSYDEDETSTSLIITASQDIIEFTGTSLATWTLPGNVPVGRLFYIVNNSPTFNGVEFSNTIITGKADVDPTAGATLIHVGSGNYAIITSF
jgi:hypothetical protein